MAERKWTPRPWFVGGARSPARFHRAIIIGSDASAEQPGVAAIGYSEIEHAACYADAHLIAAAPDLYEAAATYLAIRGPVFRGKPVGAPNSNARLQQNDEIAAEDALRAALAKARGE